VVPLLRRSIAGGSPESAHSADLAGFVRVPPARRICKDKEEEEEGTPPIDHPSSCGSEILSAQSQRWGSCVPSGQNRPSSLKREAAQPALCFTMGRDDFFFSFLFFYYYNGLPSIFLSSKRKKSSLEWLLIIRKRSCSQSTWCNNLFQHISWQRQQLQPKLCPLQTGQDEQLSSHKAPQFQSIASVALFVWLISHRPAVLFSQNKSAISNQPTILFSQNKSASAARQTDRVCAGRINQLRTPEIDVVCLRTNNFDTNIVNLSREIQLPKPLNMMSHTESQSNWQNRPRER
jgi:hypothetical protein